MERETIMTTHLIGGIQVTFSATNPAVATAVTASQLRLTTTDNFTFKYKFNSQSTSILSPVTVTPTYGSQLHSAHVGATKVNLNTAARIGEYVYNPVNGTSRESLVMMVDTGVANVKHFYVLDGDAFPLITTAAAYNTFMATVRQVHSTTRNMDVLKVPGVRLDPTEFGTYSSGGEHDVVVGAAGDNWAARALYTGAGNDTITALTTNDRIEAGTGDDSVSALAGNNTINAGTGNDTINAGDGNDRVDGGQGNDYLYGENGDDRLKGGDGNDFLYGGTGNDTIEGNFGNDLLSGADGDDTISGRYGNDTLYGGNGNDTVYGGADNDHLGGGAGNDKMRGERGDDMMYGDSGNDDMTSGQGDDQLYGGSDDDTLQAGSGNDYLSGDGGSDLLRAGDGIDTLIGGNGSDTLVGGSGADYFVFHSGSGSDTINDFRDNVDTLRFGPALAGSSVEAALADATQVGRNVVFNFGDGDIITVNRTTIAKLMNDIEII